MQVPREDSQISWINHHDRWNPNGEQEGQSHQRMARTKKSKGSTSLPRIRKLYQRFIQGYSQICIPLTKMTKKEQPFHWECEQREAFQKLKKKFILAPILASFDPERKITLETDASNQALGSCLSQPDTEEQLHPVAYRSKKFSGPELNYTVHNKKLLAIVDAFEKWQAYLERSRHSIMVYSDHKNLSYFTTTKKLNRRQVR